MSYYAQKHGSLLSEEMTLQVNPSLAVAIGLNNAIVLQQLRFCLSAPHSGKEIDGVKYVWNTYEQWCEQHFPWWSIPTIQRIFADLEKRGLIKSVQPDGTMSRKKYYTLAEGACRLLTFERVKELRNASYQFDMIDISSCDDRHINLIPSSTETSSETSSDISCSLPPNGGEIEEIYKAYPKHVGKKAALKAIGKSLKEKNPREVLERVKAYAEAISRWPSDARQFVPDPATWFNRGSYDDDPETWKRNDSQNFNKPSTKVFCK